VFGRLRRDRELEVPNPALISVTLITEDWSLEVPEVHRSRAALSSPARELSPTPLVAPPGPGDRWLEDEIDFGRYFRAFGRYWKLLVLVALVGGGCGFAVSRMRAILYEGVTTVLVLPPSKADVRSASTANFRALLENLTLSSQVISELGLDKAPFSLTPQRFYERALQVQEVTGTNLVKVRIRLSDPARAAEASRLIAHKAVALNRQISLQEGSSLRDQLKVHLDDADDRLKATEQQLLAYQREAQVELLKKDTDSMLGERGVLLRLLINIESEKARLTAAEQEIGKQERVLSVGRSVRSEDALRRAAEADETNPTNAGIADAQTLDLSNPFINPVHQTLEFQIATSRARLAALEQQRREMVEVKKLGGSELKELSDLYGRQIELARRQTNYDLAKRVYSDLAVRYEETRSETLGSSAQLQVVDDAIPPDRPLSRKGAQSTALGLVAGLLVAALAALALDGRQARGERRG
jgi:uncharacterized protein involved in exopolysaccharide biosynthesis